VPPVGSEKDGSPERGPAAPAGPLTVGRGRARVALRLRAQGRDLLLTITGGDAHVGAVAVDAPAGGTGGEAHRALTVVPGHKEGPLAAAAAARLAAVSGRTVVTVVGIHQDRATPREIAAIVANVQEGVERLAAAWRESAGSPPPGTSSPGAGTGAEDR
jgi:hypothetical protein